MQSALSKQLKVLEGILSKLQRPVEPVLAQQKTGT